MRGGGSGGGGSGLWLAALASALNSHGVAGLTCAQAGKAVSVQLTAFSGGTGALLQFPADLVPVPPASVYVLQPGSAPADAVLNFTDAYHCNSDDGECALARAVPAAAAPHDIGSGFSLARFAVLPTTSGGSANTSGGGGGGGGGGPPARFLVLFDRTDGGDYSPGAPPLRVLNADGSWGRVGAEGGGLQDSCFPGLRAAADDAGAAAGAASSSVQLFRRCRALALSPDGAWALVGNGDAARAHLLTRVDLRTGDCAAVATADLAALGVATGRARKFTAAAYSGYAKGAVLPPFYRDGAVYLTLNEGAPQVVVVNASDWRAAAVELRVDPAVGKPLTDLVGVAAGGWDGLDRDDDAGPAADGGGLGTLALLSAAPSGESDGELWSVPASGGGATLVVQSGSLAAAASVAFANAGEGDAMYVAGGAGGGIVRVCATTRCGCGADLAGASSTNALVAPLLVCGVGLLLWALQKARQNTLKAAVLRASLQQPLLGGGGGGGGGGGMLGGGIGGVGGAEGGVGGGDSEAAPRVDYVLGCGAGAAGGGMGGGGAAMSSSFKILFRELQVERVVGTGSWGRVYAGRFHGAPVAIKELLGFSGAATAGVTGAAGAAAAAAAAAAGEQQQQQQQQQEEEKIERGEDAAADAAKAAKLLLEFSKEAHILMELHHAHIIEFFGISEQPATGMLYIVTEYCDLDLQRLVRRGAAQRRHIGVHDRRSWLDLANQICSGMRYLHSQGIIHRDLKPDNVLLRPAAGGGGGEGEGGSGWAAKICDFGISKRVGAGADALSATHTRAAGTPLYMAPEVMKGAKGDSRYSGKADVYSFGVVLWSLWIGAEPFADVGDSLLDLMMAIVQGARPPFEPARCWPRGVQALLGRCWAGDPAERPTFAQLQGLLEFGALFPSGEEEDWAGGGGGGGLGDGDGDGDGLLLPPASSAGMLVGGDDGTEPYSYGAEPYLPPRAASGRGAAIEMQTSMRGGGGGLGPVSPQYCPSAAWTAAAGAGISTTGMALDEFALDSKRSVSNIL